MRTAEIERKTLETSVKLSLNLDGSGKTEISTSCGFLDHMLTLLAQHGGFDLSVTCVGDTDVDYHHTVEDIGICLGKAFAEALGDMRGITRYGSFMLPMDEALALVALDISGRSYLVYDVSLPSQKVGDFDTELGKEFWLGFIRNANITLHIRQLSGENTHHILEAIFKAVGRSLKTAVAIDEKNKDVIPSTKGVL